MEFLLVSTCYALIPILFENSVIFGTIAKTPIEPVIVKSLAKTLSATVDK